jgi:DNA modification methylase
VKTLVRTSDRTDRREPSSSDLAQGRLTIQHRPVDTLRLDPLNPREHSKKQIAQVAKSIRAFGFNVPVLIDDDNKIIAGHGRFLACKLLDITEIPTICLGHLSPEQIRAFIIADNKLTENSTWKEILLGEQLKSLSEIDLNFSLEATGFEMGEIDVLIEGLSQPGDVAQEAADALPAQGEVLVSSPGGWWQLGKHRVLCGDALDPGSYDRLMTQQRAAVVFTHPPYKVPVEGHASGLGKKQPGDFPMACGEMGRAEFTDFLRTLCKRLVGASQDGAIHFICVDWRHIGELLDAGGDVYDEITNMCVWVKVNAGMGSLYRSQHELILVFKQGKHSHRNNVQPGNFGRSRSNVWQYPDANSIDCPTAEGNLLDLHPTAKPVALVADAILDSSSRGDIILDPFLGSGTTERDTRFVELGRYLCEVRAGQYWRLEDLKCFDEFLERRFPGSRRKAYYLMSIHEHLPPQARKQLRELGWAKGLELAKLARRAGQRFDCAIWLHRAREMPQKQFKQEVEKELTGRETEPWEIIYFKLYESQMSVIEKAVETAALMLGSDRSRGYCLEMICADFLAGANLDHGDPEMLLFSMTRFFKFLPGEQRQAFLGSLRETAT